MIIAVSAMEKKLAQNLRDSTSMTDMQSTGKNINKQACLRGAMWRFTKVKNSNRTLYKDLREH